MKNLTEFMAHINEEEGTEPQVYVVKDNDGQILAVLNDEQTAKAEVKKWNKECKGTQATISQEPAKDYVKKK